MEERILVRRERDSHDRRIWRIWLTDADKELETVLPPISAEFHDLAMQGISLADRELFSQLLNQAIANLS